MPQKYLSTDPNAGESQPTKNYISTDPRAAEKDTAPADVTSGPKAKPSGYNWDVAPQMGSMVGGVGGFLLGGPIGALAGAALGGGVGGFAKGYQDPEATSSGQRISSGLLQGVVDAGVQALLEGGAQGVGRLLVKGAPGLMEQPLNRSASQRIEFPNAAKRLVQLGIRPKVAPIQKELGATENLLDQTVAGFDAARPQVAGYLGGAKQAVPLGEPPVPKGGRPGVTKAKSINPRLIELGPSAYRVERRMLPDLPEQKQFLGSPMGGARADVVKGPGAVIQPMGPTPGPGAPPTMVDPRRIVSSAERFAETEGKLKGLGKVPGKENEELSDLAIEYLRQNPDPLTLGETIAQKRAYAARSKYSGRANAPVQTSGQINFNKGIAGAAREEAVKLKPELEPMLSKEQDLIGALDAAQVAAVKPFSFSPIGLGKAAIGLRSPTIAGGGAILMDRLGRTIGPALPPLVRMALIKQMEEGEGEEEQ